MVNFSLTNHAEIITVQSICTTARNHFEMIPVGYPAKTLCNILCGYSASYDFYRVTDILPGKFRLKKIDSSYAVQHADIVFAVLRTACTDEDKLTYRLFDLWLTYGLGRSANPKLYRFPRSMPSRFVIFR